MAHRVPQFFGYSLAALAAAALLSAPARAQDKPARRVMVGGGVQTVPAYPGADGNRLAFLPAIEVWREGEPMPVETPDEGIGFAVIGKRGGTSAGPSITFAAKRSAADLPGLPEVKFGVELGGFVETYVGRSLRLRAELRHGVGAHRALAGDLAADLVLRRGMEGPVATFGPRLRWGSARYNRAYFGVQAPTPVPAFAPYEPGSGVYAAGAVAGAHIPLNRSLGVFGYAGYDRLVGKAAKSPIVAAGSRDQFSAGVALTYRFSL